jgi:hypothetical protein
MTAQTVSSCVVCGAMTDRFLCGSERHGSGCLGELLRQLGDCAALVDELNTVLSRQSKSGGTSVGYVTNGGDEQPLPIDTGAMEVGLLLRDRLCSWARALWEDHAPRDADGSLPPIKVALGVVSVSRWLMRHPDWIAIHPAVDELYRELMETLRDAWRVAHRHHPDTEYVGPCHAEIEGVQCDEDLYARPGYPTVRCKTCGTEHADVTIRQDALGAALEEQFVPLGLLVGLMKDNGHRLTTSMLRNLRARKRVTTWVSVTDGVEGAAVMDYYGFLVRVRQPEDVGLVSLFRVGEVLNALMTKGQRIAA